MEFRYLLSCGRTIRLAIVRLLSKYKIKFNISQTMVNPYVN